MDFEPQKFFIGLVDFFSVLMPGAVVAYVGKDWAGRELLQREGFPLDGAEHLVVFLFASYLIGHLVFLLGAFLDEWVYGWLRKRTPSGQIGRLAEGESLSPRWIRRLVQTDFFFGKQADAAVTKAVQIKTLALRPISAEGAVNAYQWCKARLSAEHPEGLLAVQRFEADSKFFRSFVFVLLALGAVFLFGRHWVPLLVCVGLLPPALLRYIDQRFKGTQQAYWFVITLEALEHASGPKPPEAKPDELSHAGGVVFRRRGKTVKYLLVQASKDRSQWVLPKGHIEPGEETRATAVREVLEETGTWARVIRPIDEVRFGDGADGPLIRFYLMECVEEVRRGRGKRRSPSRADDRQHVWLVLSEAKKKTRQFKETQELLGKAETLRGGWRTKT
jgi:8-oxo-dGTP pyrophosphatase MutT (NUDIX family)